MTQHQTKSNDPKDEEKTKQLEVKVAHQGKQARKMEEEIRK
jgi:hypothetical protein